MNDLTVETGTPFWDTLDDRGSLPALIVDDGPVTYADLAQLADHWAARFRDEWTTSSPDHSQRQLLIAIEIAEDIPVIAAYLGALRAGHTVLLVESLDASLMIRDVFKPNLLVSSHGEGWNAQVLNAEPLDLHPDLRLLLSTSGTTGSPKLVRLSETNIASNARSIASYLDLSPNERAITTLPLFYSYGLSVLHVHLEAGGALILNDLSVTEKPFWELAKTYGATSMACVPHQIELMAGGLLERAKLGSLRYITQAGGKLSPDQVTEFSRLGAKMGWQLFVMYGQTEASPRMAYLPPEMAASQPDVIGKAIPGGKLWVAGEDGNEITEPGIAGELWYSGPNVMMGYAEAPEELAGSAGEPRLATGDIALRTHSGLFKIVGRKKRFVKLFGLRLGLDQIEQKLAYAGHSAFCCNVNDRLVVLCCPPSNPDTVKALICEEYDLPLGAVLAAPLEHVPLLSSLKTDLRSLQTIAEQVAEEEAQKQDSEKNMPGSLRATFRKATRALEVKDEDSFSDLGGDSLGYLQVTLALEKRLGQVPDGWEHMPLFQLEQIAPLQNARHQLEPDVIIRLLAVSLIVINHLTVVLPVGGGTWVLLMIIGMSLVRFGRPLVEQGRSVKLLGKLFYPILPVYFAILILVILANRVVDPTMWTLTNNYGAAGSGFMVTPNWFVSLYVQLLAGVVLVLSFKPVRHKLAEKSWELGLFALCIAVPISLTYQYLMTGGVGQWALDELADENVDAATTFLGFIVKTPFICLPFLVAGWLIQLANTPDRRMIAAIAVVVVALTFPAPRGELSYYFVIIFLGLILVSGLTVPVSKTMSTVLRTAASTTLFVYILHGLPIQIFRHETNLLDQLGMFWSSLIVVPAAFFIAWCAKLVFDLVDVLVMRGVRWANSHSNSPATSSSTDLK